MPIPFYRCERCQREFASLEAALECENSHLQVTGAKIKQYSVYRYPYMLEVTFSDGTQRDYVADEMH